MRNLNQRTQMADETRRLRPSDLQADSDSFDALQGITDYSPANKDYTVAKIQALKNAMAQAQEAENQADAAAKAARDDATAAEWAFHNGVIQSKKQVVAQYGDDSNQAQSVGLTKTSERAKPQRQAKPAAAK
jgi:hypothetical protein